METVIQTWTLDKSHAKLGFSATHMLVSDVEGFFKNFDIKVNTTKEDFSDASIELMADINSIETQNEHRDAHLKKEDFFNSPKFPTLNFKSSSFSAKNNTGEYELSGNLSMLGVTKLVKLAVKSRMGKNPMSGSVIAGFKVTGSIKRSDFGLAPAAPAIVVSDEIEIVANAEFIRS